MGNLEGIFKYEVPVGQPEMALLIPKGSRILRFANQNEKLVFWVRCSAIKTKGFTVLPRGETIAIRIMQYMTGLPINEDVVSRIYPVYQDTIIFDNGKLVIHVYMEGLI